MRINASMAVLALAFAATTATANITQENAAKTNAVIDAAIEAYGGAERLGELKTLIVEADTVNYAVNQSRKPEPPWDKNKGYLYNAIDLENSQFVSRNTGNGAVWRNILQHHGTRSNARASPD